MSDVKASSNWDNDPEGRIRNLSLAPNAKNALFPLFEAVMNSIHAIEERFGKDELSKGRIDIDIIRAGDDCFGFRIADNGIGFHAENLASFKRMDSQTKAKIGGKGVGRLIWLKVLDSVSMTSTFAEGGKVKHLKFDFTIQDPVSGLNETTGVSAEIGSCVELNPYRSEYATGLPKKAITVANRVLAHFISYFVNISHPIIRVLDGASEIDLFEQFTKSIERDADYDFELNVAGETSEFKMHCFLLPKAISDDEKSTNALYLGANGRAVKRYDMDPVIGLKAINGKFAFLGYVESVSLDKSANDTRTDFSISEDELSEIVDLAKIKVKEFLAPEIAKIRIKQSGMVKALRYEHPRFLSVPGDETEVAASLHLATNTREEIFVELSRKSLRIYEKRKNSFKKSINKKLPDIQKAAQEYVATLKTESISSLAEYVMKRKLVLEVFEQSLAFKENGDTSEYEAVLHDIICPLKSTSQDLNYDDHNLWIIDDRLAFFSYFNSDTPMKDQVVNATNPKTRPDLSVFDLGLGFHNDDKATPITILEFKRPKHPVYTLDKNPITQVRGYVEDMRKSGYAMKYDGTPLRAIDSNSPFMCHIIADISPNLKSVMKSLGPFHQRAGTNSYYAWDAAYSIFIEISSFHDVLESAKARNRAFFERIGLYT